MKRFILITAFGYILGGAVVAQTIPNDFLDANNIKAAVSADGLLFGDGAQAMFEVPKGSGKNTIFASGLWIGGYGAGGNLKLAAQTYRQNGVDFFPGPIDTLGTYGASYDSMWNRVWKIDKCDIDAYSNWITSPAQGANPIAGTAAMDVINNWPARAIQGFTLAPFIDNNSDGFYNPAQGDVPFIRGDQAIVFCINDSRAAHGESGGAPLGINIMGMAYSYNCPYDTALSNTVFDHYRIINYTSETIDLVSIGNWTDFDIGWYNDDFIGCDVTRGAYYGYNGALDDGTGQSNAYGATPPAQAIVFLQGPYKDPNGIDDPAGSLPDAVNLGDGVVDNERLGLSGFTYINNNNSSVSGNPSTNTAFYNYLNGNWADGSSTTYGGAGVGGTEACTFVFPGESDPYGFGVGGDMNNPDSMPFWDEIVANNIPGDRRGVGAFAAFTMLPRAVVEVDFAYIFGRASSGSGLASVTEMKKNIDSVRQKFFKATDNIITACSDCPNLSNGVSQLSHKAEFKLYPNPATNNITIEYIPSSIAATIEFYDATGQMVKRLENGSVLKNVSISDMPEGLYLIQIHDGGKIISKKFLKK